MAVFEDASVSWLIRSIRRMRQGPNARRPRGRTNRKHHGGGPRPNSYDSNGPEGRIRGNAHQVFERYVALARDALSAGDRISAETYYQHAEHYFRIINSSTDPQPNGQVWPGRQGANGQTDGESPFDQDQPPAPSPAPSPAPAPAPSPAPAPAPSPAPSPAPNQAGRDTATLPDDHATPGSPKPRAAAKRAAPSAEKSKPAPSEAADDTAETDPAST